MIKDLTRTWKEFVDRFEGQRHWIPTRNDWIAHEQNGRELLLATLETLPGVEMERIEHARKFLDPIVWRSKDFLERVYPILANREEEK